MTLPPMPENAGGLSGLDVLIARLRPLEPDLTIEEKAELLAQVVLMLDERIESVLHQGKDLRRDIDLALKVLELKPK